MIRDKMTEQQEQNYKKYTRIMNELNKDDIDLIGIDGPMIILSHDGKKLRHNSITWEIYPEEKVIEMVKTAFSKMSKK